MKTISTSKQHFEKYATLLVNRKGVINAIPFTSDKIVKAIEDGNYHLNGDLSLSKWDGAVLNNRHLFGGLTLAEGVCLLKHAAIYHVAKCVPEFNKE